MVLWARGMEDLLRLFEAVSTQLLASLPPYLSKTLRLLQNSISLIQIL
jgi:hypothetical protein